MLALALAVALAQVPTPAPMRGPIGVVVTSKRAGAEAFSGKIAQRVHAALERETGQQVLDDAKTAKALKAAGYSDARKCQGLLACLSQLALILGPDAVLVSVDVGKLGNNLAVHVEAVTPDGAVLAFSDLTTSTKDYLDDSVAPFTSFARTVEDKLPRAAPPPPPPAAVAVKEPPPPPPPTPAPAVTSAPPEAVVSTQRSSSGGGSKVPAIAFGVGALLSGGASLTFLFSGMQARSVWQQSTSERVTTLTADEAQRLETAGNLRFTLALVAGIAAVAFAAVTALLLAFG